MRKFWFRFGFVLGGAVGYVLGSSAGRERYEQIAAAARRVGEAGPAKQLGTEVRNVADRVGGIVSAKTSRRVEQVAGKVKESVGGNGASTPAHEAPPMPPPHS